MMRPLVGLIMISVLSLDADSEPKPVDDLVFYESFESHQRVADGGATVRGGLFVRGFIGRGFTALDKGHGIRIPLGERFPTHEGTLELWVRPNRSGNDGGPRVFVSAGEPFANSYPLLVEHGHILRMGAIGSTTKRGQNVDWKAGRWHHLVLAWGDGKTPQLMRNEATPVLYRVTAYIDGVLVQEEHGFEPSEKGGMKMPDALWIGSRAGSDPCDTVIDELRMWKRMLGGEQIRQRYLAGRGRRESDQSEPPVDRRQQQR